MFQFSKVLNSEINYFSNVDNKFMKNFIRFLDAEFHADFENNIFFEFWKVFVSEIKYFSIVDPKSWKILFDF